MEILSISHLVASLITLSTVSAVVQYPMATTTMVNPGVTTYHPGTYLPLGHSPIPGILPFGPASFIHPFTSQIVHPNVFTTFTSPSLVNRPEAVNMFQSIPGVSVNHFAGQPVVSTMPAILNAQRAPATLTLTMTAPDCKDCKPEDLPVATVTLSKTVDGRQVTQQGGSVSGANPVTNLLVTDPITGLTTIHDVPGVTSPLTLTLTMTAPKTKIFGDDKEKKAKATVTLLVPPSFSTPMYLPTVPTVNAVAGQQVVYTNGVPTQVANPPLLVNKVITNTNYSDA